MNVNYEVIFERPVEDLASYAYLLKHKKTGARIFILSNDDDNKVFSIGFRTPPTDSTGVPHIMEHSVLCGSEKYPVKDPFIELAKGSLNTFLNAMTYPDKTVYPVASRNDKDFANLMGVYMDAVLKPNIYVHPEIFKQEGWSLRIEDPEEPITYNGVVYSEMKGAFSSPDGVLDREVVNSLFPDTPYGVESGGDPEYIPDLTYEQFIDFHKRYYHPSNSFIYLYGDMDIDERLTWLDEEYLSKYDYLAIDSAIPMQKAFGKTKETEKFYPITEEEEETENTYLSYNIVCGDNLDPERYYAFQMIEYALLDTQGAPLRQRLLDEGIGKDVMSGYDTSVLQPYFQIGVKNSDKDKKDQFLSIIREELQKAADGELDKKSLLACLNSLKFKYREADFGGYPKGLIYCLSSFDSWLYSDTEPLMHIESEATFRSLEEKIETDYFEKLIADYLLNDAHSSLVILSPKKGLAAQTEANTAEKLAKYKAGLTPEEIETLVEETKALAAYQEEEDTEEALLSIPLLSREDIKREAEEYSNIEESVDGVPFICHDYVTNGIAYVDLFFDSNDVSKEELPYLGLLKSIVSFVDTANYSYSDLNNEINIATGGLYFDSNVFSYRIKRNEMSIRSTLGIRTLYENIDKSFDLIEEVLFTGKYDDAKRLYEIIAELKSKMQVNLMSAGHAAAAGRANSYYSEVSALKEEINGIEFYKFVENLEHNFDAEKDKLIANTNALMNRIIAGDNLIVSCTADKKGCDAVAKRLSAFKKKLDEFSVANNALPSGIPAIDRRFDFYGKGLKLVQKNEAFKTSGAVNYIARAGQYIDDGNDYSGAVNVFHTIMRYGYMWFNIRVQGGAYGCMCNSSVNGDSFYVTYRDPNIARSNDVFEGIADYLDEFDADEREMTKYVIGTMSTVDQPLSPQGKGARDMGAYFSGLDVCDIQKSREQIIDCTVEDIKALASGVRRSMKAGNIACVGCESKIEEDKALFKTVRNLFE